MAQRRIFTVGFGLPGEEFEYVDFGSDQTLLDADIILFEPTLYYYDSNQSHQGKPLLSESSSFSTKERLDHWRSEITAAFHAGKLVIVYLATPIECYRYTGQKEVPGKGQSRFITNYVAPVSSYEAVPNLIKVTPKSGEGMRLQKGASYLAPYWTEFSSYCRYEVGLEGNFSQILLKASAGDRIVGAAIHGPGGALLFLPPLRYDTERFLRDDEDWTPEALKFGKRLVVALSALCDNLRRTGEMTPTPNWAVDSQYHFAEESKLESAIAKCDAEITKNQARKSALEAELAKAGTLRRLLFEQGHALEGAILDALRLMGFEAKPFSDGESEFDAVFVSPEGRCLGEAEGKDNRAVNIDKFSQLERNLQEDFAREDVTDYAKAVLFGNAHRLLPVAGRGEFFTAKCISAAKRIRAALVRTPDLFVPAKYLKEHPDDGDYAKRCREAVLHTEGDVVVFPPPPARSDAS